MRALISLGLISITILITLVMWMTGNGFYLTYVPAGTGDGITRYSPLWILVLEAAAAYGLFARLFWGILFVFAPAFALSFDIYPAWKLLGEPDVSLKFHMAVTGLMWCTAISGLAAYRYLK